MSKIRILKNCEKGQNTQIVLFLMTVFFLFMFFSLIFEGLAAPSFSKPAKKNTNTHIVSAYWIFLTEIPHFNNVCKCQLHSCKFSSESEDDARLKLTRIKGKIPQLPTFMLAIWFCFAAYGKQ